MLEVLDRQKYNLKEGVLKAKREWIELISH